MADFDDERSLADIAPDPVVVPTPEIPAEDFDVDAWLSGVRPTRRAVKLFARADLVGDLEEMMQEIEARGDDPAEDDAFVALYEQFHASGRWFHVEKRSGEWEKKFRKDTAKRLRIKLDDDGAVTSEEDGLTISIEQTAAQIVVPSAVTADRVRRLYDTNQGEANKLFLAVRMVNNEMAETVRAVGPDFSPKPSTTTPDS